MIIIYMACILNYARKIAVLIFFGLIGNCKVSRVMPIAVNEVWLS